MFRFRYIASILVALFFASLVVVPAQAGGGNPNDLLVVYLGWSFPLQGKQQTTMLIRQESGYFQVFPYQQNGQMIPEYTTSSYNVDYPATGPKAPRSFQISVYDLGRITSNWNPDCGYGMGVTLTLSKDGYTGVIVTNPYGKDTYLVRTKGRFISIPPLGSTDIKNNAVKDRFDVFIVPPGLGISVQCGSIAWDWQPINGFQYTRYLPALPVRS